MPWAEKANGSPRRRALGLAEPAALASFDSSPRTLGHGHGRQTGSKVLGTTPFPRAGSEAAQPRVAESVRSWRGANDG